MRDGVRVFVGARGTGDLLRFLHRLDVPPVVARRIFSAANAATEGQQKLVRRAVLRIAAATAFSDANEAERFGFTDRRCNRPAMVQPVFDKLLDGNRQASVIVAAVVTKLDLDARYDQVR